METKNFLEALNSMEQAVIAINVGENVPEPVFNVLRAHMAQCFDRLNATERAYREAHSYPDCEVCNGACREH